MFAPYCPRHDSRVLLFVENILGLERTATGLQIRYRCNCGHLGTWMAETRTGVHAA